MPNWCSNNVTIMTYPPGGNLSEVAEYVSKETENGVIPFSYDEVIPQPPEVLASLEHSEGGDSWYSWRTENWGCKWDNTKDMTHHEWEDKLEYHFSSPWAPPEPVMKALSEEFPHIIIAHAWDEPGVDFGGYRVWYQGEPQQEREGDSRQTSYHEMSEWALEDTIYHIKKANQEDLPLIENA